jgi:hypothetical protein
MMGVDGWSDTIKFVPVLAQALLLDKDVWWIGHSICNWSAVLA